MEKNVTSGDRNLSGKNQYTICQQVQIPSAIEIRVQLC